MHHIDNTSRPDHEAAMARADLYKLAQYSAKLFKMIHEGQQLEGWVQAKITKAADYVASVYHFMAYEMKVSEYGEQLENAEVYEDSLRQALTQRLNEAKEKVKTLKKIDAVKHKKHKTDKELEEAKIQASGVRATGNKKGKVEKTTRKQYFVKLEKEGKTKGVTMIADEGESENEVRDRAARDARSDGWTVASIRRKDDVDESRKKDITGDGKTDFDDVQAARRIASGQDKKTAINAAKSDKLKETSKKCNHTPEGKNCPVHGLKECGSMYEESKPSAGMSKAEKSAVVKKAKAGGDIGKPGKGFAKVEKAAKASGAKDPKAVAAAAMWKQQAKK